MMLRRLTIAAMIMALMTIVTACSDPDQPSISLYLAVQRGDIDQIQRHIHWGADINEVDPDGYRPLHVAAAMGEIIIVKLLLKHGAEVNSPDNSGHTPIQVALLSGRTQLADLLLKHGATLDVSGLLLEVAHKGMTDRDVISWLILHGADTEQRDGQGDTALLIAVSQNNHRLARHLLNHNINVNVKNAAGLSALQIAEAQKGQDTAKLLRRYGATSD